MKEIDEMKKKIEQFNASGIANLCSGYCLIKVGTPEWFNSDAKVSFYTGLPGIDIIQATFTHVVPVAISSLQCDWHCGIYCSLSYSRFQYSL